MDTTEASNDSFGIDVILSDGDKPAPSCPHGTFTAQVNVVTLKCAVIWTLITNLLYEILLYFFKIGPIKKHRTSRIASYGFVSHSLENVLVCFT